MSFCIQRFPEIPRDLPGAAIKASDGYAHATSRESQFTRVIAFDVSQRVRAGAVFDLADELVNVRGSFNGQLAFTINDPDSFAFEADGQQRGGYERDGKHSVHCFEVTSAK